MPTIDAQTSFSVTTSRYDSSRLAANIQETTLNRSNVNPVQFGKLWTYPVDGVIFAQPLYVQNLTIGGTNHNVLFVATMNDVVYAFDADKSGPALWTRDFRTGGATTAPSSWVAELGSNIGVLSTPVIDTPTNSGSIFIVAQTVESTGTNPPWTYRLHKMSLTTGADVIPSTVITATQSGVTFVPKQQNQRPGLVLVNGQIIICFSGRPYDDRPYQGWVMDYDATTLARKSVFITTGSGDGAGVWGSGGAPPIDSAGNIYVLTGNGFNDNGGVGYNGTTNFGETLLKISVGSSGSLGLGDWFTAYNWHALDDSDLDLSCNAPMLIPNSDLVAFGSKVADVYVAHTGGLGHLQNNNSQLAAFFHVGQPVTPQLNDGDRLLGLAYWNGPSGPIVFAWPAFDSIHSYAFGNGDSFTETSSNPITGFGEPGMPISVSANGSQSGTGIVWTTMLSASGRTVGQAGEIHAFDAEDVQHELWSTLMNGARDSVGSPAKFVIPVVANGRLYMATSSNAVQVYGLLSTTAPAARTISIDFVGSGTPMGSTEVAGVVPKSNWNSATGNIRAAGLPLVDETGAASGANVTWQSDDDWSLPITDAPGNVRMMKGYIDTGSQNPTTVTVSNLPPSANGYDVYVYTDGDNGTATEHGTYSLSGKGIASSAITVTDQPNTNFSGTFTQANGSPGNYVHFTITTSSFTLTATPGPASDGALRAEVNGIQIVPTPSTSTYTISGLVTAGGVGLSGVTVALSTGPTATTNASGSYSFTSLPSGNYTVAPSKSGYTFTPVNQSFSGITANQTANFVATSSAPTYTISGQITAGTAGLSGVTVALSTGPTATTNASGSYSFTSLPSGNYTVTPSKSGYTFAPVNQSFSGITANQTANFAATSSVSTYTISGQITFGTAGLSGVTVALSTGPTTTTDSNGSYSFTSLPSGSYTVTPSRSGYTFTPPNLTFTITGNQVANFTAATSTAVARAVSVDFVGNGTAMGLTESAGVVAKTNWNSAVNNISTQPLALIDETGVSNGATVTWHSDNNWSLPVTDAPGNVRMMRGYLDNANQDPTTVVVSGLPTSSTGYDVYVYTDGDNVAATDVGTYTITGTGISTPGVKATDLANTNFNGTFTQAVNSSGNYVKFSAINATSFTITATPTTASDGALRAPLNAIQIVPTPTTTTYTISGVVTAGTAGLSGVTVALSTGPTTTTNASGSYSFTSLPSGNYTVTPALSGYTFTPVNQSFSSITANQTANFAATSSATYTISGVVTAGTAGLSGVTVALSTGPTATTNASGSYSFTSLPSGNYTVTPSKSGYTFAPVNQSFSGITANQTANFAATSSVSTYTISGQITFGTAGLSGVTVALSTGPTTTTDSNGSYSFTSLPSGSYTVTPSRSGYTFTPPNLTFTITGNQVANFTAATSTAVARAVSVDFVGNGTAMGLTESAGVVAKTNWNSAVNNISTQPLALIDETGVSNGATVTWHSDNNWSLPVTDAPGNVRMMRGYLDNANQDPTTVVVSGLPTSSTGYDVYVYTDGDNVAATDVGTYTITGTGISTPGVKATDLANTNFNGTFTQAVNSSGNYVKFSAINATSFTITATPTTASDGALRAPLNAIQIVPTPTTTTRAVSIDFVGNGTPMAATETAGVIPKANWNSAPNNKSTAPLTLKDETGASTGASVTWTSDNNWALPITDTAGNVRMMRGYLDNANEGPVTINIANLPASPTGYDVYVYTDGDNIAATDVGTFSITGTGISNPNVSATDASNTNFNGTFQQATNSTGNYVRFTSVTATSFTITATPTTASDGYLRAPVNGVQVVPH